MPSGTLRPDVPVTALTPNFSPIPRMAPPPEGSDTAGIRLLCPRDGSPGRPSPCPFECSPGRPSLPPGARSTDLLLLVCLSTEVLLIVKTTMCQSNIEGDHAAQEVPLLLKKRPQQESGRPGLDVDVPRVACKRPI